jgi:predicted outer membrane repeat protein
MTPCYDVIQDAVDIASDGDTVKVAQGVYTSTDFQVVHINKSVTLTGGYVASDWNSSHPVTQAAIIDAENTDGRRAIYIDSGGPTVVRLVGLTIQEGRAESGAGVYVEAGEQMTVALRKNRFRRNTATTGSGGAVFVSAGDVEFADNDFRSNSADVCGGAIFLGTSSYVAGNSFHSNSASSGGAIQANGTTTITNNLFHGNSAWESVGGAVWVRAPGTTLTSNTFRDNSARMGGALQVDDRDVLVNHNQFEDNTASGTGGALACDWHAGVSLEANRFTKNEAENNGGAIYVQGGCSLNGANDVLVDNQLNYSGAAVDVSDAGLSVEHWTLVGNGETGIACYYGGASVRNSIVASHALTGVWASVWCNVFEVDYTLFHANGEPFNEWVSCASCFAGDPMFIEPAARNYHIGPGSAAVDRVVDSVVTRDFDGQLRPMRSGFDLGADEQPPLPLASFTHSAPDWSGTQIAFTNTTVVTDLMSYVWDFGDGTRTESVSPTHAYVSPGEYAVVLTATGYGGTGVASDTLQIYGAQFDSSSPDWLGQTSSFTNASVMSGTANYLWNFGDGTTDTQESPNHAYSAPGVYDVALTVSNSVTSSLAADTFTVYGSPKAGFTAQPTNGVQPLTVALVDAATTAPEGDPTLSYSWDFGDGTTSVSTSPAHTYTVSGLYTVSQTVSNAAGTDTLIRANYITVYEPVESDFTVSPFKFPLAFWFINASTGDYTSTLWNFGDGVTSTADSKLHYYSTIGTYTVTLTVAGLGGQHAEAKKVVVRGFPVYLPLVVKTR